MKKVKLVKLIKVALQKVYKNVLKFEIHIFSDD